VLAEVLWVDGLRVVGDGDVGVEQGWTIQLTHHLLVLLENSVLLLLPFAPLGCVFEGLQLLLALLGMLLFGERIES
jgi:hypothetical protein